MPLLLLFVRSGLWQLKIMYILFNINIIFTINKSYHPCEDASADSPPELRLSCAFKNCFCY